MASMIAESQGLLWEYQNIVSAAFFELLEIQRAWLGAFKPFDNFIKMPDIGVPDIVRSYLNQVPYGLDMNAFCKLPQSSGWLFKACNSFKKKLKDRLSFAHLKVQWGSYTNQYIEIAPIN